MGVERPGPVPAGASVVNMTGFFSRFPSGRERRPTIEEWSALPLVAGAALLRHVPGRAQGALWWQWGPAAAAAPPPAGRK